MTNKQALGPGTIVRLKSDPGRQGVLTGKHRVQAGISKYQVGFPEGKTFQPEYELEIVTDDNSDWVLLLESGKFGRVNDLRRNLTHIHLSGRLANLVYSMDTTNTDFYAYQFKPVLSFLDSPSNGLLIADEVGLGKTIEAGLIWTELRARYDARRLLVVCPAMLRDKWRSELSNRFGVNAEIMDARELVAHLRKSKYEITDGKGIVCSIEGLRPTSNWQDDDSNTLSPRKELAKFLDEQSDNDPLIDLVIVDEAHYLRNPESQSAKLGQLLRSVSENIILLSATPINLSSEDLYHLLNLVDPDSFGVKEVFPQVLQANEPLQKARELALDMRAKAKDIIEQLIEAKSHPLLSNSYQLNDVIDTSISDEILSEKAERIQLANQIEKINLLRHSITRTRKSEVTEWRVIREPTKTFVELDVDGPEWNFYQSVTNTIRQYAWEAEISDGFLLAGPQRQVSSCMYAAAKSWKEKLENYNEQLYEDFGYEGDNSFELSPLLDRLTSSVLPNIDLEDLRNNDSKYNKFKETVIGFLNKNPKEKVIVFSFFRNTLGYLAERLFDDGIKGQVLMGGMKESKQDIINKFKDDDSIRVLLCSEVASEGVDLQFCHVLVNYDLPWNPMKVEQRIGRIDRIGQKAEKINIINILYANTIDYKIHERLYARLKIFEKALGGMEAILGEEISDLTSSLLSKPLTEEQENQRIEQTSMAVERIRQDQEDLERQASHLIAHGGYILDEVQAAHQFKKRITEQDLVAYVKDYLAKYCKGYEFSQSSDEELIYEIRLPPNTAVALSDFINKKKLHGQTRLATTELIKCRFSNKVRNINKRTEVISQFHPLIRFISNELRENDEAFYPLVALNIDTQSAAEIEKGNYAFFVSRWVFSGIKIEEELPARVLNIDNGKMLSRESSWNLINLARVAGKDWLSVNNSIDINELESGIDSCIGRLDEDYKAIKKQRVNENIDRVNFQVQSAERHRDRQLQSRYEALEKLKASGNIKMIAPTEGRIKKVKERFNLQVEQLKQKSKLKSSSFDVCCGIINIS